MQWSFCEWRALFIEISSLRIFFTLREMGNTKSRTLALLGRLEKNSARLLELLAILPQKSSKIRKSRSQSNQTFTQWALFSSKCNLYLTSVSQAFNTTKEKLLKKSSTVTSKANPLRSEPPNSTSEASNATSSTKWSELPLKNVRIPAKYWAA